MLALEAALAHPTKVSALVLIASTARMPAAPDYPGTPALALRAMQKKLKKSPELLSEDFFRACLAPLNSEETLSQLRTEALCVPENDLDLGLTYLSETDLRDRLESVTCPVLVIHGEEDQIIAHSQGRFLADALPRSVFCSLAGQGHALLHTASESVAQTITTFLGECGV
jgi:pimeloyl-[acyl-carrier protein] methyl ester esterase